MIRSLTKSISLVTGGASGLGRATVERFAAQGAKVIMVDLPNSNGEQLARDIGPNVIFHPTDVTNEDQVNAALDEAEKQFGIVNTVINCAGIGIAMKTVSKKGAHPLDKFQRVLEVNTMGTFNVIRLSADRMSGIEPDEDGARGVIVNTASVA